MTTPGDTPDLSRPLHALPPLDPPSSNRGHWALLVVVLMLVYLMMRLSGLGLLPIFGDEAIYLRWAQLIRGEGLTIPVAGPPSASIMHPWISLADPKPPLHFWLIALVFHWSSDPLFAARQISVAAGAISIPLLYALCVELGFFLRPRDETRTGLPTFATGRILGLLSIAFFIFSPFLSFYQRLATADALFLAESLTILWLSLRWARLSIAGLRRADAWLSALFLGIAIGVGLMTRQGISYTLCAAPIAAWLFHRFINRQNPPPRAGHQLLLPFVQLAIAALLAAMLWLPYLTVELSPRALDLKRATNPAATLTTGDLAAEVKRRVFYQDNFAKTASPLAIAARNLHLTFIPGHNDRGAITSGWLFYYLTPPVYLASLLGFLYLAWRRQWLLLTFLFFWILITMGPVILLGNVIFSRYILAGIPPFLIAAAFLFGDFMGITFTRFERAPAVPWIAATIVSLALFVPCLIAIGTQSSRWTRQTLTAADNYQYISGWPAGSATENAISYLASLSTEGPLIVITDNGWGTPADALWVRLSGNPNIHLYYTDRPTILDPVESSANTYWLRRDKWLFPPYEKVTLGSDIPILYVTTERDGPALKRLSAHNPNISLDETFNGIVNPRTRTSDPDGAVSIFQLKTLSR
jgi:4-amino-4-deoxy-L-arabinose transferase-like glycosyltransferase